MKENEIIIGTPVTYWGVVKANGQKFDPFETEITSEPWEMCGTIVCNLKGKSGCFDISHLERRHPSIV